MFYQFHRKSLYISAHIMTLRIEISYDLSLLFSILILEKASCSSLTYASSSNVSPSITSTLLSASVNFRILNISSYSSIYSSIWAMNVNLVSNVSIGFSTLVSLLSLIISSLKFPLYIPFNADLR